MLIHTENLTKDYAVGKYVVHALREVSFDIAPGEYIAITGPSGSGKSTLMHLLGCLDIPSSGKYFLSSTDVTSLSDLELSKLRNRSIGFVFQTFNLLPRVTVMKNVELPLLYAGVDARTRNKKINAILERVGLSHRKTHRPNELSGGEMQRVAVARALINDPKVVFADEPTGNLDSKTGKEIMTLFNEIAAEGNTVILVTHDATIASYARRQVKMLDGKIIEDRKQS
jgi:putative ABC transport system ATP-binding protein